MILKEHLHGTRPARCSHADEVVNAIPLNDFSISTNPIHEHNQQAAATFATEFRDFLTLSVMVVTKVILVC